MQTIKNIVFYFPVKLINISLIWLLDKLLKTMFLAKTLKHYYSLWKPYGVIINDDLLKFHDNDIRVKIQGELLWNNKRECPWVKKELLK